jgi:lysophospholipase L1-like esterase
MRAPSLRVVTGVLAALLAGSLAGNAYLVRSAHRYDEAVNAVRLDPAGLDVYAGDRAAPAQATRPVLLLFGDSRALMWTPPAADGYQVVNRGIGNQTTAQILLRLDADVVPMHPAVVVLEAGVNDLKTISDFPEQRARIVADCEANLRRIVQGCRGAGATVVLTTVFAIGDIPLWRRPFFSDDVRGAVREVNAFLRGLSGDGVVLFDADPVLDDDRGRIKPAYQFDYLHLVPAGYAALDTALEGVVRGLPKR